MRNTRFITAIIAFAGTFAISVGLVWLIFGFPVKQEVYYSSQHNCSQRHSSAIYSHIQRDVSNGRERDERSFRTNNWEENGEAGYSIENHADSVAQYVDESDSLNVRDLPQEFQIAWRKHINAWRDYSEFLTEIKESSVDDKTSRKRYLASENRYNIEINRTWDEVLQIAENHGATLR